MASITCRKGGTSHTHTSVQDVRDCYGSSASPLASAPAGKYENLVNKQNGHVKPSGQFVGGGHPKSRLFDPADTADTPEREMDARFAAMEAAQEQQAYAAKMQRDDKIFAGFTDGTVSREISRALSVLEAQVPSGRYAIVAEGATKFYKIDKPKQGRWAGYVFIKVQASDEFHPVKNRNARVDVLHAIVSQGVQESMERYGRELGVCGHCSRTLTDPESIARGIGPICAGKLGW
jgi:hypothetical protein